MYLVSNIKRFLKTFVENYSFESIELFERLKELNDSEMDRLFEIISNKKADTPPQIYSNGSDKRWFDLHKSDTSFFKKILISRGIINKLKLCMDNASFFVMYNEIESNEGNLGSGDGWHYDSTSPQLKVIFYLTDVHQDNGPFQILSGSEKKYYRKMFLLKNIFKKNISRVDKINSDLRINTLTEKKGGGFLIKTNSIHRGKPLKIGRREAITFYFFKKNHINIGLDKFKSPLF